jgi:hypothetical protein
MLECTDRYLSVLVVVGSARLLALRCIPLLVPKLEAAKLEATLAD